MLIVVGPEVCKSIFHLKHTKLYYSGSHYMDVFKGMYVSHKVEYPVFKFTILLNDLI